MAHTICSITVACVVKSLATEKKCFSKKDNSNSKHYKNKFCEGVIL